MRWKKLGHVFTPDGTVSWMKSHASNPVAEHVEGDIFRVYFGSRDEKNRTSICSLLMDIRKLSVIEFESGPVIGPGQPGLFDDSGTSMGCLVKTASGVRHLYFLGWSLCVSVPWRNTIGLAISEGPGAPFVKASLGPILGQSNADPYSMSYPWVLRDEKGWRMWYGSNIAWGPKISDMKHVIKYAESPDGINWKSEGGIHIGFSYPGEFAISRPCVVKDADHYRMWFTHRGSKYRIGYAESTDGLAWKRNDAIVGIDISAEGWDSEEVCYPHVFDHKGVRYMLYNGNGYGLTGFGLATLEV